ncbi:ATP-binding protein [Leptolyngbya sp. FACHB-16]|uniref:sensor histidine kinase n=1 Tax=unclassified Leptolyngbya TaxID=2650499 RepID=UPI001F54D775|nr:ATP-binding protein [Leptolyngbya sp. FACHB-16]
MKKRIYSSLGYLAIAEEVTLSADLQVSEPITVVGNEEQLYRMVSNLIDNAIQATPVGGKVLAALSRSENYAIIQVQDTGVGINPEDQRHIFDRFYRIQGDRSRRTGGAVLGLAIVLAIVQAHQGSIHVQSQPEQGSIFTVRLPLDRK